jgi:hypothetical protein
VVTDAILAFLGWLAGLLIDSLPVVPLPAWMNSLAGFAGTVFGYAGSMGNWFNMPLALVMSSSLLGVWLVSFGVKAVRIVLSLFTGGGGGAA